MPRFFQKKRVGFGTKSQGLFARSANKKQGRFAPLARKKVVELCSCCGTRNFYCSHYCSQKFRPAANVRRKRLTTQYSRRLNTGVSLRESEYLHSSRSLLPPQAVVALVPTPHPLFWNKRTFLRKVAKNFINKGLKQTISGAVQKTASKNFKKPPF